MIDYLIYSFFTEIQSGGTSAVSKEWKGFKSIKILGDSFYFHVEDGNAVSLFFKQTP